MCNYAENNPQCSTDLSASGVVLENAVIVMTCNVTYNGMWAPVIRWMDLGTGDYFPDDNIAMATNETTVTSQLTITASADFHGSQIHCNTFFDQPAPSPPTSATNVPSYSYTWTSPTLNVHCEFVLHDLAFSHFVSSGSSNSACFRVCVHFLVYILSIILFLLHILSFDQ